MPAIIVHIEDDPAHQQFIDFLLSLRGHQVTTCATLHCAQEGLSCRVPDLILADLTLRKNDTEGCELANWRRTHRDDSDCYTFGMLEEEDIHPEAKRRLDLSFHLYDEEIARVSEQLRPEYDAILKLPEEAREFPWEALNAKEDELLQKAMVNLMLRNSRICDWCRKNGIG